MTNPLGPKFDPTPAPRGPYSVPFPEFAPRKRNRQPLLLGLVIAVIAAGVAGLLLWPQNAGGDSTPVDEFAPTAADHDPSTRINGVVRKDYPAGVHVAGNQRVAYTQTPPFGGAHDGSWLPCTGVNFAVAIRNENAVHALEHGAVWIAYNPATLDADGQAVLKGQVIAKPYMLMSPYPGLDTPISLQSWGHQLKLSDPRDPRIAQFITALRVNQYTYPEPGASCSNPTIDSNNPPLFDPNPPGPDAYSEAGVAPPPPPPAPEPAPEPPPGPEPAPEP
ncbi:DUF3105 domain-containing protein [Nocardia sp. NBC_01503]|uniref:DUF3105 domain-containing protein n=1 Tax=Nocardia sp. NBC_01503 TaxID=2975997 RepID=UPI002E7B281B|nr:DUF3105 domain-containing protein [Nocardia sp. NBC_01503]WTL33649.1 DUF3105 domain-containing protein [Nocardia sp. NBC_01503]